VEDPPPDDVTPLLGLWFMEGSPVYLRWKDGKLEARYADQEEWQPPAVIVRESDDRWRIESGWEQGELVRIERDGGGSVKRLVLGGYPVTREPTLWV
jgi:hypothetical protein